MSIQSSPVSFFTFSGRRSFIRATSGMLAGSLLSGFIPNMAFAKNDHPIRPCGPASKYAPKIRAAFVRRKENYGMWWPGEIYDGEAALKNYTQDILHSAKQLGLELSLRDQPIHSLEDGEKWIKEAQSAHADGILVVLLDRQQHAWPTATLAVDSKIPSVIFAPTGAAFTTNTSKLAGKQGVAICCTDDYSQVHYGLKMLGAGAKLRETRVIVIKGDERKSVKTAHFGTELKYVPANTFLDEYLQLSMDDEIRQMADELMRDAQKMTGATKDDVLNGIKSLAVARNILEQEQGDAITMDCLGALAKSKISLPCIAWSRMLDMGIPAACEADIGAALTHTLVQYLFDRPGFQQDPVPETSKDCLIGAHCTCPTKLNGFDQPAEPYYISNHHGKRDATARTMWRAGQRVTVVDILPIGEEQPHPEMLISTGEVIENVSVPPAGGCVVSVLVKLDNVDDYLDYPGFHQLFVYGDFKKELRQYCRLYDIKATVI